MEDIKMMEKSDKRYVKQETLKNGLFISTVCLGMEIHLVDNMIGMLGGKKGAGGRDYETLVFPEEGQWSDIDAKRYDTKEEALKGHTEMVKKYKNYKK